MIKCIVSDLDGTLLNTAHILDRESANAVKKAQAAGLEFIVATGRHDGSVVPFFNEFGIKCKCVLLNGAVYQDEQGKVLKDIPLDIDKASFVMNLLEDNGVQAHLYTGDGVAAMHPEVFQKDFRQRLRKDGMSDEEIDEILEKSNFGAVDVEIKNLDAYFATEPVIYKIEAFSNDDETMIKIRAVLDTMDGVAISNSISNNFELTDERAQKGILLEEILPQLGYAKEEVVLFGDGLNDLTMMERFPYAVAMENACPEILETASYRIGRNSDHAVAKAILSIIEKVSSER